MEFLIVVVSLFFIVFTADRIVGSKFDNIFPCYGVFGKPGSGKTLLLTYLAWKHIRRGWVVYADFPCLIKGVLPFNDADFKSGLWLPDGREGHLNVDGELNVNNQKICILIDEIGTVYNNRDFKRNFNESTLKWWSEHRHKRVKIYWASQGWKNPDLRIRESLTDGFYLCGRSLLRTVIVARPITVKTDIVNVDNGDSVGGQIVDFYKFLFFTSWKFLFLPKWIHKFNSFA